MSNRRLESPDPGGSISQKVACGIIWGDIDQRMEINAHCD
jgi:hypothetical protein